MANIEKKIPDYLLKLIEGCSTYVKISISFWMALALFSIVTISPSRTADSFIEMPFKIGKFKETDFYPFSFVIIAVLIISFGSSFVQAGRARKLIQRAIDSLKAEYVFQYNIYLQDIVDTMIYPSLNRVAPLAQMLQGKKQFFPEAEKLSRIRKMIAYIYYLILKAFATIIMYGLPGYALIISFYRSGSYKNDTWGIPWPLFWVLGVFSFLTLMQVLIADVIFATGVYKRITVKK